MAASSTPDPATILRSKSYAALLVLAAILGVPIAVFSYFFLYIVNKVQAWIYTDLPSHFSAGILRTWWPVIVLTIAGFLVGLIITKFPGTGGEVPIKGLKAGGEPPRPSYLWGVALTAVVSIGFGAVVGPEAPLIALGGGLAYFIAHTFKKNIERQAGSLVAASGSFASVSTLLGSPLTGAFLLMEAAGTGGLMLEVALLPGILAAGIGYLIFVGLDNLTGLGTFSLTVPNLPPYGSPTFSQFLWAIGIGIIAPLLVFIIRRAGLAYYAFLKRNLMPFTVLAGLLIGLLSVAFTSWTGHSNSYILFSGQNQLAPLLSNGAKFSVGTLLLILMMKGVAYGLSIVSFRGGPTFPAMFLGAVIGVLLSNVTGLVMIAGVAIGVGAMVTAMLRLPLTAVLLTTIFLGADGVKTMPLIIVAVVISYMITARLNVTENAHV
jgi:H+/Cl- antiporter ClcA